MNRCSFCEWIPILPLPVWPLAGQFLLGQNVVVGSMTLLLAVRGNIATRSMSGPPFALQLHRTTVWCGATLHAFDTANAAIVEGLMWTAIAAAALKRFLASMTQLLAAVP